MVFKPFTMPDSPFLEEWKLEYDKIKYSKTRERLIKISKEYCDEKYRKKKIS